MVRARVGHFVEAQILEAIGVNYMDESEAIALTNEDNFINKQNFRCPFVSRCENLREALSRVREGAAMIVEAVFCVWEWEWDESETCARVFNFLFV